MLQIIVEWKGCLCANNEQRNELNLAKVKEEVNLERCF